MKFGTFVVLSSLALGTAACASKQRPGPVTWVDAPSPPTVTVRNDNWLDVVVYLVRGASRFRIGTVNGTSSQTFRLPAAGLGGGTPLQIMADPIGSNAGYLTDPIVLGPGQRLELKVGSPISISSYSVWSR